MRESDDEDNESRMCSTNENLLSSDGLALWADTPCIVSAPSPPSPASEKSEKLKNQSARM